MPDSGLLSVIVWLPVAAGLLIMGLARSAAVARWSCLAVALLEWIPACDPVARLRARRRLPVRRAARLDRAFQRAVLPRHRRHRAGADSADAPAHAGGCRRGLAGDRPAHGSVLRRPADSAGADAGRFLRAGQSAVLRILGIHARPDVPDHRHLGRRAADLRNGQVFPLHFSGLGVHVGRAGLSVPEGGQLRHTRPARRASHACRAATAVLRIPGRVCGEGADVAGAYLAARCARGSADRRFGHSGGDPAEDGRLRHAAVQPAGYAGCRLPVRAADRGPVAGRDRVYRRRGAWPSATSRS